MADRRDTHLTRSGGWALSAPVDPDIWGLPEYATAGDRGDPTSDPHEIVADLVVESPSPHPGASAVEDVTDVESRRRRWTGVAVGALAVLMVGAAASGFVARSALDRKQRQIVVLQEQFDQNLTELKSARIDRGSARRAVVACQALVEDTATLIDQETRLDSLFADPALRTVEPGSAHEDVLYQQIAGLTAQVEHSQLEVQVDAAGCTLATG